MISIVSMLNYLCQTVQIMYAHTLFIFFLQMLMSVRLNTMVAVYMSASTSLEITGAHAMMASAWHMMGTIV